MGRGTISYSKAEKPNLTKIFISPAYKEEESKFYIRPFHTYKEGTKDLAAQKRWGLSDVPNKISVSTYYIRPDTMNEDCDFMIEGEFDIGDKSYIKKERLDLKSVPIKMEFLDFDEKDWTVKKRVVATNFLKSFNNKFNKVNKKVKKMKKI